MFLPLCLAGRIWRISYSKSQVPAVVGYIKNQEMHHQKETFLDEYRKMLTVFDIEWDEQYIFKELE